MSRVNDKNRIIVASSIILAAAAVLLLEFIGLNADRTVNQIITSGDYSILPADESEQTKMLHAWKAYTDTEYTTASDVYSSLIYSLNPETEKIARYNLAELYLHKAVELETSDKADARIPLLELAKENYRSILRKDSEHWSSRYNLARVLRILPDIDITPPPQEDDVMPERSQSAPIETIGYERLP